MTIAWVKQFLTVLMWPVLGYLSTSGIITMVQDADHRPDWYIVAAVIVAASIRSSWQVRQTRARDA